MISAEVHKNVNVIDMKVENIYYVIWKYLHRFLKKF